MHEDMTSLAQPYRLGGPVQWWINLGKTIWLSLEAQLHGDH